MYSVCGMLRSAFVAAGAACALLGSALAPAEGAVSAMS